VKSLRRQFLLSFLFGAMAMAQTAESNSGLTTNPIYQKNCAKCHGKTAEGRHFGGPPLTSEKAATIPEDELKNTIANGKGRMPKYAGKLTSEEIDVLVRQIKLGNVGK
jgi:Cytochrome c, mono- and diheme variants